MKIIFLDVDSVLNFNLKPVWDKQAVQNFNDLIKLSQANVVITSTNYKSKFNIDDLNKIFKSQGVTANIIGATPNLDMDRGIEIAYWLNKYRKKLDITGWAVIDSDIQDIIKHITECNNIFRVNVGRGLRDVKLKNKLVEHLE